MFRTIVAVVHGAREAAMAVFLATMGLLNISPDSQASFLHQLLRWSFEASEIWHIALSIASLGFFLGTLAFAILKNRKDFSALFWKVWRDRKSIFK